jgi:hypothetical protein
MFNDPLRSNGRPIVERVSFRGNVFTESLPNNESILHNMYLKYIINFDTNLHLVFLRVRTQAENSDTNDRKSDRRMQLRCVENFLYSHA